MRLLSARFCLLLGSALVITSAFAQDATAPTAGSVPDTATAPPQDPTPTAAEPGQDDPATGDEIVVTGIRSSLANSARVKRDAQQIVDSISAEDVGKFPDSNIEQLPTSQKA